MPFIKRYMMGNEFINGKDRWHLWLADATEAEIDSLPSVRERVDRVREMRASSNDAGARKKAATPHLFREQRNPDRFVAVPIVSSQRRKYVPMGYLGSDVIAGNNLFMIEGATIYHFGVLTSSVHNAWMRTVGARLKSDYTYSKEIVYNNFVWPQPINEQRALIERCAQAVLDARDNYPDRSLAALYDPGKMPDDLKAAHAALDAAVEAAYGVDFNGDEEKIVAHLFKLYAEAIKEG